MLGLGVGFRLWTRGVVGGVELGVVCWVGLFCFVLGRCGWGGSLGGWFLELLTWKGCEFGESSAEVVVVCRDVSGWVSIRW